MPRAKGSKHDHENRGSRQTKAQQTKVMKKQKITEYTIVWIDDHTGQEHSDRHDRRGVITFLKKHLWTKISSIRWNDRVLY